jgi:hypothetical protein
MKEKKREAVEKGEVKVKEKKELKKQFPMV